MNKNSIKQSNITEDKIQVYFEKYKFLIYDLSDKNFTNFYIELINN